VRAPDTLNGGAARHPNGGGRQRPDDRRTGNDIYVVDAAATSDSERGRGHRHGAGPDGQPARSQIENLVGNGSGQTLTGKALANTLSGGANEDLAGAGGYDNLSGRFSGGHRGWATRGEQRGGGWRHHRQMARLISRWRRQNRRVIERGGNDLDKSIYGRSDHLRQRMVRQTTLAPKSRATRPPTGLTLDIQLAKPGFGDGRLFGWAIRPSIRPRPHKMPNDPTLQKAVDAALH